MNRKKEVKALFEGAKKDFEEVGGLPALKTGEWLPKIIEKSFRSYFENANKEYFEKKYGTNDKDKIASKLTSVTARNAAILGGVTGVAVSTDELLGLVATGTTAGLSLPANIAVAITAVGAEAILLVRFQLQLVANLAKLNGVELDPNDPEDILVIMAYALGGSVSEAAGKAGMKVGGRVARKAVKNVFKKDVLKAVQKLGRQVGVKILQKSIVKYSVPIFSMSIGASWNYLSIKAVSRIAQKHFDQRGSSGSGDDNDVAGDLVVQ